jgi:hypothetical protein
VSPANVSLGERLELVFAPPVVDQDRVHAEDPVALEPIDAALDRGA